MSFISVLFGGFFSAQIFSRIVSKNPESSRLRLVAVFLGIKTGGPSGHKDPSTGGQTTSPTTRKKGTNQNSSTVDDSAHESMCLSYSY